MVTAEEFEHGEGLWSNFEDPFPEWPLIFEEEEEEESQPEWEKTE